MRERVGLKAQNPVCSLNKPSDAVGMACVVFTATDFETRGVVCLKLEDRLLVTVSATRLQRVGR
jgi:hypothetical protein